MGELKLILTHFKILDTVKWLNDSHLYATQLGIFKIVHGDIDEDTVSLTDCPTFSTLTSYESKKICRYILALHRYGYLIKVFDRKTNVLYLSITLKGRDALEVFHKRHRGGYKKTARKFKSQIIKIEK